MELALTKAEPPKQERRGGGRTSQWDAIIAQLTSEENYGEWFRVGTDVTAAQQAHAGTIARNLGWKANTRLVPADDTKTTYVVDADGNVTDEVETEGTGVYAEMYMRIGETLAEYKARKANKGATDATDADQGDEGNEGGGEAPEVAEVPQTAAQKAKARAAAKKASAAK